MLPANRLQKHQQFRKATLVQMTMAIWIFILFIFPVANSQLIIPFNQTDLQAAMADMRAASYHGFVILLRILNSNPNFLPDREITFLMPKDDELSKLAPTQDHLQEFILGHSMPAALMFSHLLHFPNGTLVPSGLPNRMLNVSSSKSGVLMNNARIINANVCVSSLIRCHGISTALSFSRIDSSPETQSLGGTEPPSPRTQWKRRSSSVRLKKSPVSH